VDEAGAEGDQRWRQVARVADQALVLGGISVAGSGRLEVAGGRVHVGNLVQDRPIEPRVLFTVNQLESLLEGGQGLV
jgi:hypothetical protein